MGKRRHDPDKFSIALGLRIRKLRKERGWTLEECEQHGWKNWRHLQTIENGKNITVYTLVNVSNLFGISPSDLLKDL
jgi:transcriptional regulator with XRE-family HTH domain